MQQLGLQWAAAWPAAGRRRADLYAGLHAHCPAPPHAPARSPAPPQGGFSWVAFTLLLLQPRAPAHRLGSAALVATQLPALLAYCSQHHAGALRTCMAVGSFKVCLLALLPHVAVCRLEARARRLFLQGRRRAERR